MKKWEYIYFREFFNWESKDWEIGFTDDEGKWQRYPTSERQVLLDDFGKEGWELVSVVSTIDSMESGWGKATARYFFKREIENN